MDESWDITFSEISKYEELTDWPPILSSVLFTVIVAIFLYRRFPRIFGKDLNEVYDEYGLEAVLSDVLSLAITFVIARYAYACVPENEYPIVSFLAILIITKLLQDLLFYQIVQKTPNGYNILIDSYKKYRKNENLWKILVVNFFLLVASALLAMIFKELPAHILVSFSLFVSFTASYVIETTNLYTRFS